MTPLKALFSLIARATCALKRGLVNSPKPCLPLFIIHYALELYCRSHFFIPDSPYLRFSHSVMSDSLQPHEPQHNSPPCPSPTPRVHLNSCPLSRWCHPSMSSSVIPFSSCLQSFPASGSFQMSQLFTSGGQNIGVSVQHWSFQWTPRADLF